MNGNTTRATPTTGRPGLQRYGSWALVTGASSGIGQALARRIAADGVNLVIAARRIDRLEALADELRASDGVEVRTVQVDLSTDDGVDLLDKAVADVDLGLVVANAGSAHPGAFLRTSIEDQLDVIRLNVVTPLEMAHRLGGRLVEQGRGALILTGSTSAFAGTAMLAGYAATKSFVGVLAEGLNREWAGDGVDVVVVHPGPTRTEMVDMEGVDFGRVPVAWMDPDQVAQAAVRGLGRRAVVIPGLANRIQTFVFTRLMPRRAASAIWSTLMGRVTDPALQANPRP
jgi:short-subunit dehydrogenase